MHTVLTVCICFQEASNNTDIRAAEVAIPDSPEVIQDGARKQPPAPPDRGQCHRVAVSGTPGGLTPTGVLLAAAPT